MRIAHCSDLHLLSLDGIRLLDFANKRWIGGLNLLANRGRHHIPEIFDAMVDDLNEQAPDQVVVTGDLTNLAFEQEFQFARQFFDRLTMGSANVTVIPGNHDAYVQKGAEHFSAHFADYFSSDADVASSGGDQWPLVRVRDRVLFVGLSTSLETPWFTAYGVIGDRQLRRLEEVLSDGRYSDMMRIVLIHHPPAGERARNRIRGLKDHHAFANVLARAGADLVLHGHEHQDLTHYLPGPSRQIPIRGIQSGTYEAGKPRLRARYRIYEVGDQAGELAVVGETLRVWDPATERFTEDRSGAAQSAA